MRKEIEFLENPYCEHCNELEPFTPVFYNDTYWCLYCAEANGDITEEEIEEAEKKATEYKIKFFSKRLKELHKELKKKI